MNTFQKILEANQNFPISSLAEFNKSENFVTNHYLDKSFHKLLQIECARLAFIVSNSCESRLLKQDYSHGWNNIAVSFFNLNKFDRWNETIHYCVKDKNVQLNIEVLAYMFCYNIANCIDISLSLMNLEIQTKSIYNFLTKPSESFIGYLPTEKTGLQSIIRAKQKLEIIFDILNRDPSESSTAWVFMIEKGQVNSLYKILSQLTYIEAAYREISPKEIISTL